MACAPGDKDYPATATKPKDGYPLPASVDLKSGGLVGECLWERKECVKGQWTGCHDAVGPKAAEDCVSSDGKDDDCNDVPNRRSDGQPSTECSRNGGDRIACGECGKGVATTPCGRSYLVIVCNPYLPSGGVDKVVEECR